MSKRKIVLWGTLIVCLGIVAIVYILVTNTHLRFTILEMINIKVNTESSSQDIDMNEINTDQQKVSKESISTQQELAPSSDWRLLENTKFGYQLHYPTDTTISCEQFGGGDPETCEFVHIGRLVIEAMRESQMPIPEVNETRALPLSEYAKAIWQMNIDDQEKEAKKHVGPLKEVTLGNTPAYQFEVSGSYTFEAGGYILKEPATYVFFRGDGLNMVAHYESSNENAERILDTLGMSAPPTKTDMDTIMNDGSNTLFATLEESITGNFIQNGIKHFYTQGTVIPTFSSNGRHVAYMLERYKKSTSFGREQMVYDGHTPFFWRESTGVSETLSPDVSHVVFSPDGTHVAYVTNDKSFVFITVKNLQSGVSEAGKKYPAGSRVISDVKFSRDANRLAYHVTNRSNRDATYVIDGFEKEWVATAKQFIFSSGGKHYAYITSAKSMPTQETLIVDGKEVGAGSQIIDHAINERGDVVYVVMEGVQEAMTQGGDESFLKTTLYLNGSPVGVDQAGTIEQVALSPSGMLHYQMRGTQEQAVEEYVVSSDSIGKKYVIISNLNNLISSPVGDNVAYVGVTDDTTHEVVFGNSSYLLDKTTAFQRNSLAVSPTGASVAYTVCEGANTKDEARNLPHCFVVVNGKAGEKYNQIWGPFFSTDGNCIGYGALKGKELWWIFQNVE